MVATLQLNDVGVRYGKREVLSGITTPALRGGEVTAVIGPNAAGKSSLFRRIAGLLGGPGDISIGGIPEQSRSQVCYMPQDTSVNTVLTVYESILLARKQGADPRVSDEDLETVDEVLGSLRIESIAFKGLSELSGGQRQLVSLAQTLVRDPEILLLDEPTSALDLHRQVEVLALIQALARKRQMCVVLAIHDLNQVLRVADRVMVIDGGTMVRCGPAEAVITPELLREIYKVEGRIERCSRLCCQVIIDGPIAQRA
ncbi:ABC transporter ATP-binding protein [Microvirga makkahensis]|uniref:ATP-binding cassette domain-containing protein n=1 Tax=Microvirga makkahensis TaxID=1128670 RepID=A0A7X3MVY9_9HYPH|nr:ABC transporter ATP-binding protein [Microvirga makkahensis]MXQ14234.1 ATP-binding cassette domain-containing protein [Microvirga makkahensis]